MLQRLSRERRIGDDVVEGLERVAVLELGIGQRVALHDERGGVVVQDHVHAGEAAGGGVLFLPVERDGCARPHRPPSAAASPSRRSGRRRWWRCVVFASRMPMICAMMRLTSAGV